MRSCAYIYVWVLLGLVLSYEARAGDSYAASPAVTGIIGLNTVPSARMDEKGTLRVGLSNLDPYIHGFIGFQIAEPLYISLRQTSESSRLFDDPERLFPGVDLKLRLRQEDAAFPAIAIGMNSAIGHKRTASEYLVFSKRWKDFDFTGGLGWGRMGSAAHITNPLEIFGAHFDKDRDSDGDMPSEMNDWFTGRDVGVFGGVEYFTPWDGVSVKADIGADRYMAEAQALDFDTPAPWSVSVNYNPADWMSVSAGIAGTDKLMGRISFQGPIGKWPGRRTVKSDPVPVQKARADRGQPGEMAISARQDGIMLQDPRQDGSLASANLMVDMSLPLSTQIGRAARHMANHGGHKIETLSVTPYNYGLKGPAVKILRRDLEMAAAHKKGSPDEIWQNAEIAQDGRGISDMRYSTEHEWAFILDNKLSLSEEDSGVLYRSSAVLNHRKYWWHGFTFAEGLRLDLKDNLHRLRDFKPLPRLPVRSDEDQFSDRRLSMDHAFLSWMKTIKNDWHLQASVGYLEEMYSGVGGEVLYRPFGKTFALGAEAWQVFKRDPNTSWDLGHNGDHILSGHVNAWYEIPESNMTLQARIGRYLAEDIGGTLSLSQRFDNGTVLEGFVTATDQSDLDVFGGTTHLYSGMRLSLPIGNIPYMLKNSELRLNVNPIGRDTGQALDKPLRLYDVTEKLSYRELTQSWPQILD